MRTDEMPLSAFFFLLNTMKQHDRAWGGSAYRWGRHRWRKAEWKPCSGSWCQRAPRWTDTHNLWPPSHFPLHCPRRRPTFDPARKKPKRGALIWSIFFFLLQRRRLSLSHLFAAEVKVEVLEIPEALVCEARAAQRAGDVGQRGEVVPERTVALRLHVQLAVAVTGREILQAVKVLRSSSFITGAASSQEAICRSASRTLGLFIMLNPDELR